MDKIGYIYKMTTPTGRVYVGQTRRIMDRQRRYKQNSMKSQKRLRDALTKYGFHGMDFTIIESISVDMLNEREIYWIEFYNSHFEKYPESKGLNCTSGGAGCPGRKWTPEEHVRNKGRFAGDKNPNYGRKHTEEAREKIAASRRGKPAWFKGRSHTEETKAKISAIRKTQPSSRGVGFKNSPEARAKISASRSALIIDIFTGIFYNGNKEAAKALNVNVNTLKYWLNPNSKTGKNRTNLRYA